MDRRRRTSRTHRRRPQSRLRKRVSGAKIYVVFLVLLIGIGWASYRLFRVQFTYGEDYARLQAAQIARRDIRGAAQTFAPAMGGFYDRNMQPITGTTQVYTVFLNVQGLQDAYRAGRTVVIDTAADGTEITDCIRNATFNSIVSNLNVSRFQLYDMFTLDANGNLVQQAGRYRRVLEHNVPIETATALVANNRYIGLEETSLRWHQDPFFAPQVLGFQRGDTFSGLEARYRNEIAGVEGRSVFVGGETEIIPPRDGYTIITTLDSELQRLMQATVNDMFSEHASLHTAGMLMDPNTGEILAMAQAPSFSLGDPFNPDYFTCPALREAWGDMTDFERTQGVMSLWNNYHVTRSAEPGSTFKPFVMAAAYEEGLIGHHDRFSCHGRREILNREVFCWNRWGCGDNLSLRRVMYRSCNLAMVDINNRLGPDRFYRYRGYFGFGERTGIDLPAEEAVNSPLVMYQRSQLNLVEMATSSMGQGFNATTMQIVAGYAALINGGNLMQPFLVSQILDRNGNLVQEIEPTVVRRAISPETSHFIRNEMRYVISMRPGVGEVTGTGHMAYIPGFSIGGKTGTAQQGIRDDRNHTLTFVSFMPVENPQFLLLLTVDHIEDPYLFSGGVISPYKRDFYTELIRIRNLQPTGAADTGVVEHFNDIMPDFTGQRLADIAPTINNWGTGGFLVVGGGTNILRHSPPAGRPQPQTSPVIFFMDSDTRIGELMVVVPDVTGLSAHAAENLMREIGLPASVVVERGIIPDAADFHPHTAQPEFIDPYAEAPPPPPYIVTQQFPEAGSEIERGTQVLLRAR